MATIDPNGVLIYQDTDNYTPIQTALNLAQSNLSSIIGASAQIVKVSSVGDRNAKAAARGSISKANPFVVWRADAADSLQYEYTTNGTTWHAIMTSEIPPYNQVLFEDANMVIGLRELHGTVTVYAYGTNPLASGVAWKPTTVPAGYRPFMPSATGTLIPRQNDRVMSGIKVASNGDLTILNRTGADITDGWDALVTYVR